MSKQELATVAKAMVAPAKGLLAMDESNRTCKCENCPGRFA
jgi:fructose-bisphosphate aldolase class 1